MASPASVEIIPFGEFEANLRSRELWRKGVKVRLPDQSFQVLVMLLEHPGELVPREEIKKRLWPADTFVDFDHGLNNAVNRLREALDDSAESPRLIETLPRRGYRFVGVVDPFVREQTSSAVVSPARTVQELRLRPSGRVRRLYAWTAVVGGVVLVLLLAGLKVHTRRKLTSGPIRSIAVLPLKNLSGDPSQDYFAEGMTDALITDLANISSLRVISRTSAMHYKSSELSLPEIARELKVDAVVEGSVVRSGNRVRVSAQLVHAPSDLHLWAKAYDRDMREILSVQQDIAQSIVREIQAKLSPAEENKLARARPLNGESYEAYLKGRYYWNKRSLGGFNQGLAFFQQAIQADPTYAPAYAGMAHCYNFLGLGMGPMSPREYAQRARAAAQKALEMDGNLAEAHAALGFTLYRYDWNWADAERQYRRAIELDPRNAIFRGWLAELLLSLGRSEEARAQREQVRDLDPFSIQGIRAVAGAYGMAKQYDKAIDYYKKAIELDPDSFRMRMDLGGDYLAAGRYQEAAEEFQQVLKIYGPNVYPLARLGYAYALSGKRTEAEKVLDELKKQGRGGYPSYASAEICAVLGRKEEALQWLQRAYKERSPQMVGLAKDPAFAPLRNNSRFQDLVQRVGLPPNDPSSKDL